jgi:hypothetical protein
MAGFDVDSVQLGSALAAAALIGVAWALPWRPIGQLLQATYILPGVRALARRRAAAILFVALVALGGDALVSWCRPPLPVATDEFSYLLAADTFAAGRLTNPTPLQWQFFETPQVLFQPTYQSKYPPGQGLFLALGQRLAGTPMAGVWLSSALSCGAFCWMLQAWVGQAWALYGGLLAAFQLAFFGHWAQSYWGGMVAALGGALVYGALRRLAKTGGSGQVGSAIALALGLVILANTRPFEGALAVLPGLAALAVCWARQRPAWPRLISEVALPAIALLLLGAFLTLTYDRRVTGSAWQMPYQAYQRQYDPVPSFIFQRLRPWPHLQNVAMEASAVSTLAAWRWAHGFYRVVFVTSKLFGLWQFAFAAVLSAAFVMLSWAERCPKWIVTLQAIVFVAAQGLAVNQVLFWPAPSPLWIMVLLLALVTQAVLLVRYFLEAWNRVGLCALGFVALGLMVETYRFHSHYMAPVIPVAVALGVQAIRRGWDWTVGSRAPGKILALGIPILVLAAAAAGAARPRGRLELWAEQRAAMQKRLESLPGRQLVIVHYGPQHDFYEEWVENGADLQAAPVIWAREGSTKKNCELMATYSGRAVWRLDADHERLEKYTPDCDGGEKRPAPSVPVLESLPER